MIIPLARKYNRHIDIKKLTKVTMQSSQTETNISLKHCVNLNGITIFKLTSLICHAYIINVSYKTQGYEIHIRGTLDKETYPYLNANASFLKCGHLYLLPKIHKIKDNILTVFTNGTCSVRRFSPGRSLFNQHIEQVLTVITF